MGIPPFVVQLVSLGLFVRFGMPSASLATFYVLPFRQPNGYCIRVAEQPLHLPKNAPKKKKEELLFA